MKKDEANLKEKLPIEKEADSKFDNEPVIVLKQNNSLVYGGTLLLIVLYSFAIFGHILPVLKAGSFAAAWPDENRIMERIKMYYLSWLLLIMSPVTIQLILRLGTYYFYNNRLEFAPFALRKKQTLYYDEMYLYVYGNTGVIATKKQIPDWSHPINRIKTKYVDAIVLGRFDFHKNKIAGMQISKGLWKNPEDGPKAMQLLREKALCIIKENN